MHQDRHIRVRGERRDETNIRKLGRALIALAQAEAEKAAQAEHEAKEPKAAKAGKSKRLKNMGQA